MVRKKAKRNNGFSLTEIEPTSAKHVKFLDRYIMKKNMTNIGRMLFAIIAIVFMAISQPLFAQSEKATKGQKPEPALANELVELPATYPNGEAGLLNDIMRNLKYPTIARVHETQGTVVVRFMVKKDGNIGKIVIKKSLSRECDQAAKDVVKKLRKFTPAKQKGKPVAVWFTLPIRFRLQ